MPTLYQLTRDEDISAASRGPYRLLEERRDLSAGDSDRRKLRKNRSGEDLRMTKRMLSVLLQSP